MFEIIEPTLAILEYKLYPYISKLSRFRKKTTVFDDDLLGVNK
ncbi:MAG: hypothetical protein OEM28_01855 [Nitrosopumilus sp.]|nr:hypothetical protein [Nitrosopumilus sp.]MDH3487822.1 hypothetical protein [Nitrosopumilus sp.]